MTREALIGKLILEAQCKLNELGVNYVFILEDCDTVFTNANPSLADKMIMDMAYFRQQVIEKTLDAKVEKLLDKGDWNKDDD